MLKDGQVGAPGKGTKQMVSFECWPSPSCLKFLIQLESPACQQPPRTIIEGEPLQLGFLLSHVGNNNLCARVHLNFILEFHNLLGEVMLVEI